MIDKNSLPYFKTKKEEVHLILCHFLLRKFRPSLRKKFTCHYLISRDLRSYLKFVKQVSKTHPYFLYFDIEKYFPSIDHSILLSEISSNYQQLTGEMLSRRFKCILKKDLPQFLQSSPFPSQGLPISTPLSYILAGIYLLKLDLSFPVPFLRFADDYLLFCKTKRQAQELLKNIIVPTTSKLSLSLNNKKLKSGKFHQDKVNFLGFEFYSGFIRISENKVEEFRQRIKELTYLTRKKSIKAVIKQLNNQILGFGHYYKLAQAKQIFEELDAFIRSRLRRYINRNKDSKRKDTNLILTNQVLRQSGLKSLVKIYEKYASKKNVKLRKSNEIRYKTGKRKTLKLLGFTEISIQYQQKLILNQLDRITTLIKKLEKRTREVEKKLEKQKITK